MTTPPVLHPGATVSGYGRVIGRSDGTWFEPPLPRFRPLRGVPAIAPPASLAIPVAGVDLTRLEKRQEVDGTVEGWARLTGTWDGQGLQATGFAGGARQASGAPGNSRPWHWSKPPCPPPPGGWPSGRIDPAIDYSVIPESAGKVALTVFRPWPGSEVLVVAAVRPDLVEVALRPLLGAALCVVPSTVTKAEIVAVREALAESAEPWTVYGHGATSDADGLPLVAVDMVRVTEPFAGWASTVTPGLLAVSAWLVPDPG